MQSFPELLSAVETRLQQGKLFAQQPQNLYEPCTYLLGLGGKRIRPVLCLMAAELFDKIPEDAWSAAMGIELFHNFTLIHDDIMDKAPLRRGQPTIHHKYGLTAGILSGDVMCIAAYRQIAAVRSQLAPVLQLFNQVAIEICEGQQLDMDFETRNDVSVDDYLGMIALKTSVLVAASLKIGALIGGATEGASNKLYAFGKNLGLAFQLQDDYLDAFGDSQATGKQAGGDILANKKTYLHLYAQANVSSAQAQKMQALISEGGPDKVNGMLAIFRETGADKACREAVEMYSGRAFSCLEEVAVLSKRKEPLHALAQSLLQRTS